MMKNNILYGIADGQSLNLLDAIRDSASAETPLLITSLKLTRKQYYTRMNTFKRAGLINKKDGVYVLTSFGKVVSHVLQTIREAHAENWKLRAIDAAPPVDAQKLRALLITNPTILEAIK